MGNKEKSILEGMEFNAWKYYMEERIMNTRQAVKIEKSNFTQKLMVLVLPIAFQQFMLAAVSASDALMLGQVDQNSLSAVSLAGQIQFILNLFLAAMTIGTSIFTAQYWGKGDKKSIEKIFAMVIKVSATVSAMFFIAGLCVPELLMSIFTKDKILMDMGSSYLRIVSVSYLLCGISQIYLCIMKNTSLAIKSTIISSAAVILNIVFNGILIFGLMGAPKMGIIGAAVATVIARIIELAWAVFDSLKDKRIKLRIKYVLFTERRMKKDFWKYTSPVLGNEIVWGCGFTMTSVIMGHLGTDAVAANSVASIVRNLVACLCIGIGSGGGIIVGNELGAGELEKAKEYGHRLCKMSIISGAVSGIFIILIIPFILGAVDLSVQAEDYLKWMLVMCSYYMIGKSINSTTVGGIFCSGGDSKFGFICDTITLWCITVPLGLISAFLLDLPVIVVYFIVNLDEIIKLPAVYRNYKKYKWIKDLTVKVG